MSGVYVKLLVSVLDNETFWRNIRPAEADECWEWIGSRNPAGYGRFSVRDRAGQWRSFAAHRLAYFTLRDDPYNLVMDHLCNNPPCVNPWHLEPVTLHINSQRTSRRGRWRAVHTPQTAPERHDSNYRRYIDLVRRDIATGKLRRGDLIPVPPKRQDFRFHVDKRGSRAVIDWLTGDGTAELRDGRLYVAVRSSEVTE